MDTKVFSAYNDGSKRVISPRLTVVDAEREPLKVLKILMEGLAPDARSGIWLIHFRGVPVARSHSAFDLLYLDDEYRVVHAIEISERSEFAPFRGQPSSALILPPTSLSRSKTFTGDRLNISPAELRTVDTTPAGPSKRTPHLPARVVPAFGAKAFNVPSETNQDAGPAATVSGRLMRSGRLAVDRSPRLRPSMPSVVPKSVEARLEKPEGKIVPINLAPDPLPMIEPAEAQQAPVPNELAPIVPVTAPVQPDAPAATERTLVAHSFPPLNTVLYESNEPSSIQQAPEEFSSVAPVDGNHTLQPHLPSSQPVRSEWKPESSASDRRTWDVEFLYMLFPELDPSYRPEFQTPVIDFLKETQIQAIEKISKKVRLLSWVYPDLELPTVQKRQRQRRRAPRIPVPGLVGYYFSGGHSKPHEIRNLSVMGFYMVTEERWMPGTVIRVTLQMKDSKGEDPLDTITVLSRIVNWGPDGGGFEFVLPGFID